MQKIMVANRFAGVINLKQNAFVTHRTESHYFRLFDGFGINKKILLQLRESKIKNVWVFYKKKESIALWKTTVGKWIKYGTDWVWGGNSKKHLHPRILNEKQLVLSKKYFDVM